MKKKLNWDKIEYKTEQVEQGAGQELIKAFRDFNIEMAGQAKDFALYRDIEETDGVISYYFSPGSYTRLLAASYNFMAFACEPPDPKKVKFVAGRELSSF